MTPRRRSSRKRGWPERLYERHGYFSWRHPETGEEFGLGRDRASAFAQALEANLHIAKATRQERLVDRLQNGGKSRTVATWFERYAELLEQRKLAANTRRGYKSLAVRAVECLGADTKLRAVTALQVTEALDAVIATGKERMAQALRSFLRESFRAAIVQGWLDENPVRDVRGPPVHVKRARLTLEVFLAVYNAALPWLRNAMALALITAQRREDIALAQFSAVRDGAWWLVQGKTKARLCLSLDLKLAVFGLSLGDVVRQCRTSGALSKYLIHQTVDRGNSPVGKPIWKDTVSRRFTDTLAALKLDFEGKDPPTFHEIRSLSERLYAAQGGINTQELLGHTDPKTTAGYHAPRGEWVKVNSK